MSIMDNFFTKEELYRKWMLIHGKFLVIRNFINYRKLPTDSEINDWTMHISSFNNDFYILVNETIRSILAEKKEND